MPLRTSWAQRGEQILMDRALNRNTYRVGEDTDYKDYLEKTERETNRWFGFTQAAAEAKVDENEQPASGSYSWSMPESERMNNAYDIERVFEKKTTTLVSQTPPPTFGSVTFSPAQNLNVTAWPISLTLSTSTPLASLMYQINAFNSAGQVVYGEWVEVAATSTVVSVNTTTLAAGANILNQGNFHKAVFISAKAFRVLQSGRYESAQSTIYFAQRAPTVTQITNSHWSPLGSSTVNGAVNVTMPFNLTINTGQPSATIFTFVAYYNGSSFVTQSGWTNRGNSPITLTGLTCPVITSGNYVGKRIMQVNSFPAVILDGIEYRGAQNSGAAPGKVYTSN